MTVAELKEQIKDMPDDYDIVIQVYDYDFDSQVKYRVTIESLPDEKEVLIYGT